MARSFKNFMLFYRYLKDRNTSGLTKLLFLLPLVYFISPFDLFPDIIFPFGYLEDVGLLIFSWQMIKRELEKYRLGSNPKKNVNRDNVVNLNRDEYDAE